MATTKPIRRAERTEAVFHMTRAAETLRRRAVRQRFVARLLDERAFINEARAMLIEQRAAGLVEVEPRS